MASVLLGLLNDLTIASPSKFQPFDMSQLHEKVNHLQRHVNMCPMLTHSEDQYLGPDIDRACIKPPRGAPWKPVRYQDLVHTRHAEVFYFDQHF